MTYRTWTVAELEERDAEITRNLMALKAWSNRKMSAKNRLRVVEILRAEQQVITNELMARAGVIA